MQPLRPLEDVLGRQHRQPDPANPAPAGGGSPEPAAAAVPAPAPAAAPAPAPATPPPAPVLAPVPITAPLHTLERTTLYVNREQSWLAFNRRVLEEAQDPANPLLERVKFLAISSTNLDEFFEIRVAGVMELVDAGLQGENPDGLRPQEELDRVRQSARALLVDMHRTWREHLLPELQKAGIEFRPIRQLTQAQQKWVDGHFQKEIYPILTPLAIDPAHPFPVLLNKSLNLVVLLLDPRQARRTYRMAVVQVPRVLPRIVRLPEIDGVRGSYVFTAEIIRENLRELFPGLEVVHSSTFRVTRDSNLDVDEIQGTDLMSSIEKELVKRRRGEPVRLEIDQGVHPDVLDRFLKAFGLDAEDVYLCDGPVNLGRIMELHQMVEAPELKDPPAPPRRTWSWSSADEMFADLRDGDVLLHHPYESFATVEDFIRFAARDPKVLAIKQTIYRAGHKNPLVDALIEAAQQRKQVTAIVELKARFDEEANIQWARRMEQAGVHVVYGIVGLKTHAKCTLVVRREEDGIKRYCHLGTGNYNPATARLYTDIGLLTARADVGEEVSETFNMITGYSRVPQMEHLLVAPFTLRDKLMQLIRAEIEHKKAGRPAGIRAKLNNLADPQIIQALYEASRAGVRVQLCVRSVCCLRPGVPGLSDHITVVSIVDRFLEHSRVYYFENAGNPHVYLSSADWMVRNLDRRVEVAAPILDPEQKKRVIDEVLTMALTDNVKARRVLANGQSERIQRAEGEAPMRSQQALLEMTLKQPEASADGAGGEGQKRRKKKKKG